MVRRTSLIIFFAILLSSCSKDVGLEHGCNLERIVPELRLSYTEKIAEKHHFTSTDRCIKNVQIPVAVLNYDGIDVSGEMGCSYTINSKYKYLKRDTILVSSIYVFLSDENKCGGSFSVISSEHK